MDFDCLHLLDASDHSTASWYSLGELTVVINIHNSLLSYYLSTATVTIGTLRPPTVHHSVTCSTLWRRWISRKRMVAVISCSTWERHSSWERTFIQTFKIYTSNSAALRTNNEIFLLDTYHQNVIASSCYAFISKSGLVKIHLCSVTMSSINILKSLIMYTKFNG